MAETLNDYAESLGPTGDFRVGCIFQQEADLLSVHFDDKPHYAERVDKFLTLFKAFDGGSLVGFELKGIKHKIEEMIKTLKPNEDSSIKLDIQCEPHINLLLTFYMKDSQTAGRQAYQMVYETAGQMSELRIPSELVH
jgi:hypothetical protein